MWRICLWILGFKGSYYKANQIPGGGHVMFYFTSIFFFAAKGTIYFVSCSHGNSDLSHMERFNMLFSRVTTSCFCMKAGHLNLKISPLVTCARIVISLVHYPHSRNIF